MCYVRNPIVSSLSLLCFYRIVIRHVLCGCSGVLTLSFQVMPLFTGEGVCKRHFYVETGRFICFFVFSVFCVVCFCVKPYVCSICLEVFVYIGLNAV